MSFAESTSSSTLSPPRSVTQTASRAVNNINNNNKNATTASASSSSSRPTSNGQAIVNNSEAASKLAEALDDFLGDIERKFKGISDEILTRLDEMAERCDRLEGELLRRETVGGGDGGIVVNTASLSNGNGNAGIPTAAGTSSSNNPS